MPLSSRLRSSLLFVDQVCALTGTNRSTVPSLTPSLHPCTLPRVVCRAFSYHPPTAVAVTLSPNKTSKKVTAHGGIPKVSTYSVSKAALNALTKMHAHELKSARIRYAPRQWPARVSHTRTHPHVPCPAKCTEQMYGSAQCSR